MVTGGYESFSGVGCEDDGVREIVNGRWLEVVVLSLDMGNGAVGDGLGIARRRPRARDRPC